MTPTLAIAYNQDAVYMRQYFPQNLVQKAIAETSAAATKAFFRLILKNDIMAIVKQRNGCVYTLNTVKTGKF